MPAETNLVIATDQNFKIFQGDTWICTLTFVDSSSDPISFENCTLRLEIKKTIASCPPDEILTETDGITIGGGSHNVLSINKQLSLIGNATYKYTLKVKFPSGQISTYLKGDLKIIA